jgi:predicted transcriptional regulator
MKLSDIIEKLDLTVLTARTSTGNEVKGGYVSDLLSDVMGNAKEGQLWITLQSHRNILAIASLKELAGIIIVRNIQPDSETLAKAESEGIPVLTTGKDAFTVAGLLYEILK